MIILTSKRRLLRNHHLCIECEERRARFCFRGKVKADADHTLCFRCHRALKNRLRWHDDLDWIRQQGKPAHSFRHILDDVRRDFARALLQDRSLSIGDLAFFLQYSEPATFHRSFRRWTDRTPRAFREA